MKTTKYILTLALTVCCALGNLYAIETSYYTSLNGKSGKELFDAVQAVSKTGYKSLSYNALWTAHCAIDINSDGYVWDMYSNATSYVCGGTAQGAQNPGSEGGCYNREHSIPKSWFGGTTSSGTPGTDLFHVVPVDGFINSKRQATAYGEVASATYTSISGCKLGSPKTISISNSILNASGSSTPSCTQSKVFEPLDEYKGDLARGYFGTMVKWAGDYVTFTTAEGAAIFSTAYDAEHYYGLTGYGVALLLKWHREDPVSQKEIDRNNGIQNRQGNRNPFIDYPELAEYIWGEHSGETVTLSSLTPTFVDGYTPEAATTYTVVLSRNGELESITGVTGTYNLPASSDAACDGWTFAGWSATKVTSTTSQPSFITSVNAGGTVYAVYSKTSTPAPHRAKMADTEVTFTPGTDTGETSVTKNNVTCTMTTMSNGSYYQIYANQSGTFSCSAGNITKIEFTCTASGTSKYGPGNASADVGTYSYSGSKGTWTGSASSVTISSTAQVRMSSLTVTYSGSGGGGSSTTYDSEPEDCRCSGQFDAPTVNASASDETITLTWADITGATNGYTVLIGTGVGYTTECSEPEIGSITNSNGNNTCAITGLVNGLEYTASVFANGTTTTCDGIADTATATPIGCQAWADPTFTYTTPLTAGGGAVTPTIGSGYGTPTFTSSNTSVLTVDEDGKISPVSAGTATVTAHWPGDDTHCPKDVVSNTITVKGTVVLTFNANDGSDNPATTTQNFTYGEAQALTANTFSRTGYTFQGWSTSPSGTKVYENGASVTLTEATTLYAVWQANKHSVTFSQPENGGTFTVNGSSSSPVNNVDFGSTVTIVVTPTNSHFTVNTVTVSGDVVAGGSGNNWSFTMPDNDVTVTVTMTEETKYTVKWYVNNFTTPETNYAGSTLAGIANPSIDCNGKIFQGWTETANYSDDTAPADLFTNPSTKTMPSNNNTCYYAVFATVETTGSSSESWSETAITDLTSSDVFVIVGASNGSNYAMTNDNGTSSAPNVSPVTISEGGELTAAPNDNLKWNISGNSTDGYTFYPNGSSATWLYCNTTSSSSNNNNIRVGTGNRKEWTLDTNGYLVTKDNYVERYLSIYVNNETAQDFRGYVNTNNGAFEPKFYKYTAGSATTITGYTTSCDAPTEVTVTFHANYDGADPATTTQTITYNTAAALEANPFDRTGYTFQGWATSANGAVAYTDEQSLTLTSNLNLYAVWQKNSHKVSYTVNPAGSATVEVNSSSNSPQSIQYGEPVTVTITADDAYRISSITATEVALDGEGNTRTFTMPDADVAITLAMALIPTHTVTWSVLGEDSNPETYKEGAPITFPAEDPSGCDGKAFVGWTTDPILLTDDAPSLITSATMGVSDITYYAVFAKAETSGSGSGTELLREGFDDEATSDSNAEISETDFANFPTSSKAYKGSGGLKLGSSRAVGYITSKQLDLSSAFTVSLDVKKYGSDTGDVEILIDDDANTKQKVLNSQINLTDYTNFEFEFSAATSSSTITIQTTKRAYIDNVVVSTGSVSTTTYSGYTTLCYKAYTRGFYNEGDYATFCFPYTVRHLDGATAYNVEGRYLNGTTLTGIQLVAETEELTAGQSYVIQSSATTMYAWYSPREKAANDTIHTQGLVGNLGEKDMSVPAGCYGLSGNQLRRVAEGANAKVGQYKAYFRLNGEVPKADASVTLPGSKTMHVIVDTPTDLDDADALQSINWNEPVYNILGIRVGKDATGVLIQNGRKYLR